jgi:hypothetical protein
MTHHSLNSSNISKFKFKVSSDTQTLKIENKLHTSNSKWHRVNIPIPKRQNKGRARKDWTIARPKPSRANIKS